jgi:hypothetical protein
MHANGAGARAAMAGTDGEGMRHCSGEFADGRRHMEQVRGNLGEEDYDMSARVERGVADRWDCPPCLQGKDNSNHLKIMHGIVLFMMAQLS